MVADFMIAANSMTVTDFMMITPNTILICDVYWSYIDKTFLDFHETRLLNTKKGGGGNYEKENNRCGMDWLVRN